MKKLITILVISMMGFTFTSCDKESEKIETNITVTRIACEHCGSRDIQVFSPPPAYSHLPKSYVCNVCGKGGNLYPKKK